MSDKTEWPWSPYDDMTIAEIVDDVLVRGDLSEKYARDQLVRIIERRIARATQVEVRFEVGEQWPTPNSCLRTADALDAITPARYGDILRAYAHAEDRRFDEHGPIESIRSRARSTR